MIDYTPIQKGLKQEAKTEDVNNLLLVRSVNQCINDAKSRPIPKMLFSEFWHEEELCILFADTNLGKSILAVQIANSISNGEAIRGFKLEAKKQVVMYFDFEMSDKQFEKRYSINYANHYIFDNNFLRIEINPDCTDFNDFEKALFEAIENNIVLYDAKILIIDNLTRNGAMDAGMLFQSPYTNYDSKGVIGIFPEHEAKRILDILQEIKYNAA